MPTFKPAALIQSAALAFTMATLAPAHASTLERALNCQLTAEELPALINTLRAESSAFQTPVARLGMPTLDVFKLATPVTVHGVTADEVAIAPARISIVVRGATSPQLAAPLNLQRAEPDAPGAEPNPYVPWLRAVQPGYTSVVAYQSSHQRLAGSALLGCQYAHKNAGRWPVTYSDADLQKMLDVLGKPSGKK